MHFRYMRTDSGKNSAFYNVHNMQCIWFASFIWCRLPSHRSHCAFLAFQMCHRTECLHGFHRFYGFVCVVSLKNNLSQNIDFFFQLSALKRVVLSFNRNNKNDKMRTLCQLSYKCYMRLKICKQNYRFHVL